MSQHIKFMTSLCSKPIRTIRNMHEEYLLKLRTEEYNSNVNRNTRDSGYYYITTTTTTTTTITTTMTTTITTTMTTTSTTNLLITIVRHLKVMMVNTKSLQYKKRTY